MAELCELPGATTADVLTSLYTENKPFVLGYAIGLLKDPYLAEDVVQETMLRAWWHFGEFSPDRGSVRAWLLKIAHNIAMDKIRMRRSRPAEVAADTAPEAMVGDHAEGVATAMLLDQALATLSPALRALIEEFYLNGQTAREIAAKLGIPEGTVYSRSHYALRALRQALKQGSE
jgi:RNA polymerase sigma-70 factor, ECF subfamily